MMPPAPTRIVDVPAATWPMTTDVAALATRRHVVVLRQPVAVVAPTLGVLREVEGIAKRLRGIAASVMGARSRMENNGMIST